MDCREFDRCLDALLDGTCAPEAWQQADTHKTGCPRCRELFDALAGRGDDLEPQDHEAMAAGILARTSGMTCPSAHERLCDYVDETLPAVDRELVCQHVAHCEACAELAEALELTRAVLPSFAEIDAPAGFALDVLRATTRRPARESVGSRVTEWLLRLAARPRFSLEAAYALTLVLVLLVGNPVKAYKDVTTATGPVVRPRVEAVAGRVAEPLAARARGWRASTASALTAARQGAAQESVAWQSHASSMAAWWEARVAAPVRSWIDTGWTWTMAAYNAVRAAIEQMFSRPTEPARRPAR